MHLHLHTKRIFIVLCFLFGFGMIAQETDSLVSKEEEVKTTSTILNSNERQKFITLTHGFNLPISSGDNFIGNGLNGQGGLAFKFQLYVYNQFFIGFGLNSNYFDVKDQTIVGNYIKTTVNEQLLNIGYEFLPIDKLRLGVLASIYGEARFKNKFPSSEVETYQIDHSRLQNFGLSVKYDLSRIVMVYLDYSYSIAKTDINVPAELEDIFRKGTYHNIGVGLAFNIGKRDLVSRFQD